jgi:hypothetical protein
MQLVDTQAYPIVNLQYLFCALKYVYHLWRLSRLTNCTSTVLVLRQLAIKPEYEAIFCTVAMMQFFILQKHLFGKTCIFS